MPAPLTAPALEKPAIAGGTPVKTTPYAKHQRYGPEELAELKEALEQNTLFYAQGKKVKAMETDAAKAIGSRFAIACSSGTASVHCALIAAGISPGDEVIITPLTDMGSLIPLLLQGAIPVFADVEPGNGNMSTAAVAAAITPKTRAVVAVHLTGVACDLDGLMKLCAKHNLPLIEDCAQSWGCRYHDRSVGTHGIMGCFSFNEYKHLSCGDGGLIVTDDETLAARLRMATDKCYNRVQGAAIREPVFLANNYRMTELQGAVARAQLRKLPAIADFNNSYGNALNAALFNLPGIRPPEIPAPCYPTYFSYLFRIDPAILGVDSKTFAAALSAEGLQAGSRFIGSCVYQYPIFKNHSAFDHGQHPYVARTYAKGDCPTAEEFLNTCIVLQVKYGYTPADLEETIHAIQKVARWYAAQKREA